LKLGIDISFAVDDNVVSRGKSLDRTAHPGRTEDDRDGQVSWLAGQCFPAAFSGCPNGMMARSLTAYSCRGSAGFEPASLFIFLAKEPVAAAALGQMLHCGQ
jgi:hypothetical protein